MKSLFSLLGVVVFMFCFSCAPSYDSAQWAKPKHHKKVSKICKNQTKVKRGKNPNGSFLSIR
jgi:phage-related protein